MIFDRLETSSAYDALGEWFAAGFAYLRKTNFTAVADGRYGIVGDDDVFAIVQAYATKPRAQGRWEAHRRYADIQYVVSAAESMGVAPLNTMKTQAPYDDERDLEFFEGEGQFLVVKAGEFTVFFPHDAHMPSLAIAEPQTVKKVVVKVRLR